MKKNRKKVKRVLYSFCFFIYSFFKKIFSNIREFFLGIKIKFRVYNFPLGKILKISFIFLISILMIFLAKILDKKEEKPSYLTKEIEHLAQYEETLILNSDEIFFNKIKQISEVNTNEYNSIKHAIFNIVNYSCDLNCDISDLYNLNLNDFRESLNLALKNDVKKLDINVLLKNNLIKLYIDKNGNNFVVNPNIYMFRLNSSNNEVLLSDVLETEKVYKSIGSGFEMEIYQDYSNGKKVILNNEDYVFYKPKFANYSLGEALFNKIIYKEVYKGVDILETVDNAGIKEDIILKNRLSLTEDGKFIINYKIKTSDLVLRVVDGGLKFYRSLSDLEMEESILGVNVRDYSDSQVVMYVPAPYMIDGKGKRSENIKFERVIEKDAISEGVYHIRLVADVLDLKFPILIDPSTYVNFLDTGVSNYGIKVDGYWDNSTSSIKSYNNLVDTNSKVWDFSDKSDYVYGDNIMFDNDFIKLINYQGQVYPTVLNSDDTYTVVIQPNEDSVSDVYIMTEDVTSSNYNNNSLMVGNFDGSNYKSLILFSDLVKFKNIKSAKLTFYHNSSFSESVEADLNIHKLLKSFDETSVTSTLRDGSNAWNQVGASSYYDYSSYVYDTYNYSHGEYYNGEVSFDVTDILNDYSLNNEKNYGFLVSCDANTFGSRKTFYSSANATANLRPKLEITFSYPKINSHFSSNDKVSISWDPVYLKNDNLDDNTFASYDIWVTDLENGFGNSYYVSNGINLSSYDEVGIEISDSSNLENVWIGYLKIIGEKNGTSYENLLDLDFDVSSFDSNFPKENLKDSDVSSYFSFDSNSGYIKIINAADVIVRRIELYGNNFTDLASISAVARNSADPSGTWAYEVELDILSQDGIPTSALSAYKIASISDITETSFLWDKNNEFLTPVSDKEYYLKLGVNFQDSSVLWSPEYNLKIENESFWQDTIISEDYYYNSYDSFKPSSLNNYSEIGIEVKDSDLEKDVTIDYMEFLGSSSLSSNSNLLLNNINVSSFSSAHPKENLLLNNSSSYFSFDDNMGYITTTGSSLSLSELKIDGHNFSYDAEINLVARYSRDGNFYGSYENFEKDSDCIGWAGSKLSTSYSSSYYLGGYNLAEGVFLTDGPPAAQAYVRTYNFDEVVTSFRVTQIIRRDDFSEVSDHAPWGWYIDNRYNGSQNLSIRPIYNFLTDTFSTTLAVSGYSISDTVSYEISEIDEHTRLVSFVVNIPEAQATNMITIYMYPHNQSSSIYTEYPFQFGLVQVTKGDEFYSFSGSPIHEDGIKPANYYEEDLYLSENNRFTFSAYKDMSDYDGIFRGLFAIHKSDSYNNFIELYQRDSTSEMTLALHNNIGDTEFADSFSVDSGNIVYDLDINDEGGFYDIKLYGNSILKVSESVSKAVFDFYEIDKLIIGKGRRANISYWNSFVYYYEYLNDRVNFDIPEYGYIPTHDANYYSTYIPVTFKNELEKITTSYNETLVDNKLSFLTTPVKNKFYSDSFYDSMIGYWKLDSAGSYIADSSGNNLYGTSIGSIASASGIYSDAIVFDGSSYIEIPDFDFESKFDELSMFCPAGEYSSGNMCMKCVGESWSFYGANYCIIPELVSDDTVHLVSRNVLVLMGNGYNAVNNAIFYANDGDFIYIGPGNYDISEDLNLNKNVYLRMTGDVYFE